MNNVLGILLLSIVLLVYIFEIIQKKRKRLKKKRIIEGLYPNVLKAKNTFENHTSFKSGYFNNNKLDSWETSYILLKKELNRYKIETLKLENIIVVDIKKLFNYFENGNTIRDEYNKEFVAHELKECNALFSNIEGQSLDEQHVRYENYKFSKPFGSRDFKIRSIITMIYNSHLIGFSVTNTNISSKFLQFFKLFS